MDIPIQDLYKARTGVLRLYEIHACVYVCIYIYVYIHPLGVTRVMTPSIEPGLWSSMLPTTSLYPRPRYLCEHVFSRMDSAVELMA